MAHDVFPEPIHAVGGLVEVLAAYIENDVGDADVGVGLDVLKHLLRLTGEAAPAI